MFEVYIERDTSVHQVDFSVVSPCSLSRKWGNGTTTTELGLNAEGAARTCQIVAHNGSKQLHLFPKTYHIFRDFCYQKAIHVTFRLKNLWSPKNTIHTARSPPWRARIPRPRPPATRTGCCRRWAPAWAVPVARAEAATSAAPAVA